MFIIRQMQLEDVDALADMEIGIAEISFGDGAIRDAEFHKKRILSAFMKDPGGMLVLEYGGDALGWLWMDKRENYLTGECYINFRSFYISEKIRGQGQTEALLRKGLEYCKSVNAERITGKVHADNLPMRAIYKSLGFKPTHITMEMETRE